MDFERSWDSFSLIVDFKQLSRRILENESSWVCLKLAGGMCIGGKELNPERVRVLVSCQPETFWSDVSLIVDKAKKLSFVEIFSLSFANVLISFSSSLFIISCFYIRMLL